MLGFWSKMLRKMSSVQVLLEIAEICQNEITCTSESTHALLPISDSSAIVCLQEFKVPHSNLLCILRAYLVVDHYPNCVLPIRISSYLLVVPFRSTSSAADDCRFPGFDYILSLAWPRPHESVSTLCNKFVFRPRQLYQECVSYL